MRAYRMVVSLGTTGTLSSCRNMHRTVVRKQRQRAGHCACVATGTSSSTTNCHIIITHSRPRTRPASPRLPPALPGMLLRPSPAPSPSTTPSTVISLRSAASARHYQLGSRVDESFTAFSVLAHFNLPEFP